MSSNGDSILQVLEKFLGDLHSCIDTHRFEEILLGSQILKGSDVGASPEAWTRLHLIRRLLVSVGFEWENEIYGKGEGYPDFGITNLDISVIGEDKSINKIKDAVDLSLN